MNFRKASPSSIIFWLLVGCAILADRSSAQKSHNRWKPDIPKTWVDAEIAELEVPLANPIGSPKHISADYLARKFASSPR